MKLPIAFTALAIVAACDGASDPPDPPLFPAPTGPVVFVGDSITAHWDDPSAVSPTITELVPRSVVVAYPGQTSVQIAAQFPQAVLELHPSVVVIEAGTNDVIHLHNASDNAVSEMANLATYEGARVVLTTIPATSIPQYGVTVDEIAGFNLDVGYLCESYGYTCVDYQAALMLPNGAENMADFEPDGIHPNAAGYKAMWGALQTALQGR